jgi:uncharacterized protein YndB with AHSA1/START domain
VPTTRRSRTIASPAAQLWEVIRDPHHLPRWWPRVLRVEGVQDGAFTEVLESDKGKLVRADFTVIAAEQQPHRLRWEQQLAGSPFARLLARAETEVSLHEEGDVTEVTIELRQSLAGVLPRLGGYLVARAAATTLEEALEGLDRISGPHGG